MPRVAGRGISRDGAAILRREWRDFREIRAPRAAGQGMGVRGGSHTEA